MKHLKEQIKGKNKHIAELENKVEEFMEFEEKTIKAFENGHYSNDIRLTVYELLSMGVGSKKVSNIICTVLERVGKMKVNRPLKPTIIKYMAIEQGMLAKQAAQQAIDSSSASVTLHVHVDGTSKKHHHFISYLSILKLPMKFYAN